MPLANYQFNETSPSSAGTVASSQPVLGQDTFNVLPGVIEGLDEYEGLEIVAELVGATGGTLDVFVQTSPDRGSTWFDLIHFPQLASGAPAVVYQAPVSTSTNTTTTQQVGKNLSPALANGVVVNGAFTDRIRLAMKAGTGTTQGTAVVVHVAPQRPRLKEGGETA